MPVCQVVINSKNVEECVNVRSVMRISEVPKPDQVPPSAGADNIESVCATRSCFADIFNKEHRTDKVKIRIHTTERGKFSIAKGSPVPKKKIQSKPSANSNSKVIASSTNKKAAFQFSTNGKSLEDKLSHTASKQTLSVGKFTPVKRKFPEGGRGDVRSLVNIFKHKITKPTWDENTRSESPAKKLRHSQRD